MTIFSVLICTYNRPEMLSMALEALIERTYEKPDQVIVVNGGDERSDCIVQKYVVWPGIQVQLVKTVNKNLAVSRNIGLAYCTGDIVAMTDDDADVFPDWVTQMKRLHDEHPEAGGVGGMVIGAESDNSLLSRIADKIVFSSPSKATYVRTIAGVNVSYKRTALLLVGQQDETLVRGEDVDFNWRMKLTGYEIFYSPEIKVIHHHRPTVRGLIHQFYMYGQAYYVVRWKWPEMYSVYPHGIATIKDALKTVNFVLRIFYQPIFQMFRFRPWYVWPVVYCILVLSGCAWSYGVVRQWLIFTFRRFAKE
jgi:GT2 family glycosyltransferase